MEIILRSLGILLAGIIAGAINSVAGGGSLVSFPTLVAVGLPSVAANATNTAALWPGALSSAITYSRQIRPDRKLLVTILVPSIVGGLIGAMVLVKTPPAVFDFIVPFLILFATLLFALRGVIDRWSKSKIEGQPVTLLGRIWGFLFQFFIATYGGYFGAGAGILMLGSFSIMGMRDILEMNGLKTIAGTCINVIAFIYFAVRGLVEWPLAAVMAVGAIIGGFGGARVAQRIDPRVLRFSIIAIGLGVSIWFFIK